jgi:isopentenyl-diphosphate delta-isomerase type 1
VAAAKEEWFDVVDRQDQVIGRALRREVHARALWHRAIHVLVFDAAGRIFLQKRSLRKDMSPGLWDSSCSGHLDSGEDYDAAAQRELAEELGLLVARPPARWFRVEACVETGWEFVWVYRLHANGPFTLHPDEIDEGAWLDPVELTARIAAEPGRFAPAFRLIWERAQGVG